MEFDIDDDGTVRVDGKTETGYSVAANIVDIPGLSVPSESLVFNNADPDTHTHAGATSTLTVIHNETKHNIIETATPQDLDLPSLEVYATQNTQRRAIVAWMPTAGSDATELVLAAVESRFTKGVFIPLEPFN